MLLLGVMPLFAVAISGSTDHVLLFLPRSVTYDPDKAIDLSAGTSGSTVTASITSISDDPRVFTTESANNLAVFRIYIQQPEK